MDSHTKNPKELMEHLGWCKEAKRIKAAADSATSTSVNLAVSKGGKKKNKKK